MPRRRPNPNSTNHLPYFSSGSDISIEARLRLMAQETGLVVAGMQGQCTEVLDTMTEDRGRLKTTYSMLLASTKDEGAQREVAALSHEQCLVMARTLAKKQDASIGRVNNKIKEMTRNLRKLRAELASHCATLVRDHDLEKMQIMRETEQRPKINMHWSNMLITTPYEKRVMERYDDLEQALKEQQEPRRPKPETES